MKKHIFILIAASLLVTSCNTDDAATKFVEQYPSSFSFVEYETVAKESPIEYPYRDEYTFLENGELIKTRYFTDSNTIVAVNGTFNLEENTDGQFINITLEDSSITNSCLRGTQEYIFVKSKDQIVNRTFACDGPNYVYNKVDD